MPTQATPIAVEEDAHGRLLVQWRTSSGRGWSLLDQANLQSSGQDLLPIDLSQLRQFIERRIAWGDPQPWLTAQAGDDAIQFVNFDLTQSITIPIPELHLLRPFVADERLLLIGEQALWEISLEQAMLETFAAPISVRPVAASPPTTAAPTAVRVMLTLPPTVLPSPTLPVLPPRATALPTPSPAPTLPPTPSPAPTLPPTPSPTPTSPPTATLAPTAITPPTPTPVPSALAQVDAAVANLRLGPGTDYEVGGQVRQDEQLVITGRNEKGDWWEVRNPTGGVAWISGGLVHTSSVGNLRVKQAPPLHCPHLDLSARHCRYPSLRRD